MRIEYVKLRNYIGIYNGTGLTEIEVDFNDIKVSKNIISLLSGENGSGKSTFMSTLHPFASTMDGRTSIILPGMDGYKEIHISEGDTVFKIEHHYHQQANGSIKMKSFFSKKKRTDSKFKQLNPNGTVKSFKELVLKELDVDESFFKLARIGSDTAGFIDMTPAKRKEYLSMFLSEVDRYLSAYKVINTKYSAVNKNIKFVVDQINKLEDEDRLNDRKKNLTNQISVADETKTKNQSHIDKNLGEIATLDPSNDLYNQYQVNLNKYNDKRKNVVVLTQSLESARQEFPDVTDFNDEINKLRVEEESLKQRLEQHKKNLHETKEEILELKNELFELQSQMDSFSIEKTVEEYQELIAHYTDKMNELIEYRDNSKHLYEKYSNIDIMDLNVAQSRLDKIRKQIDNSISKYSLDRINEIKSFNVSGTSIEISQIKEAIRVAEDMLVNLRKDETTYSSNLSLVKVLDQRPSECGIDSCPFIAKALEHSGDGVKLSEVRKEIEQLVNAISNHNKRLTSINDKVSLYYQLETIYQSNVEDCLDIFKKLPHSEHFDGFENFLLHLTKDKSMIDFSDIIDFKNVENDIAELDDKIIVLNGLMNNSKKMESVLKTLESNYEKTNAKLASTQIEQLSTEEEIRIISNDLIVIVGEVALFEGIIEKENEVKESKNEINELKTFLMSIKEKVQRIKDLKEENESLKQVVELNTRQLSSLNKEMDEVKFNIEKLSEYKQRKKELDDNFNVLSTLRTALSTTKGIPLLFIDVYLKKTKKIANELLEIIFKGKFYIEDFKLTESDFFISVRKPDGELVEDVTGASQGEKALISIALSFALIQQSLRKYNILCLDEMDATLDASNRRSFIDMIERQLKTMGVEQCFIISHNEAFDPYPVNLLLFPGSSVDKNNIDFMHNKKIVSDLTEF